MGYLFLDKRCILNFKEHEVYDILYSARAFFWPRLIVASSSLIKVFCAVSSQR